MGSCAGSNCVSKRKSPSQKAHKKQSLAENASNQIGVRSEEPTIIEGTHFNQVEEREERGRPRSRPLINFEEEPISQPSNRRRESEQNNVEEGQAQNPEESNDIILVLFQLYQLVRRNRIQAGEEEPSENLDDFLQFIRLIQLLNQHQEVVGLSGQEIERLPIKTSLHGDLMCPVCQSQVEKGEDIMILPCKHAFHPECIRPWLQKSNQCPLCRQAIKFS